MNTGTTHPVLVVGVCKKSGEVDSYVVKLVGGDRMSPRACCFELIASFIAMELEMSIPDPAIIEITQAFADFYDGKNNADRRSDKPNMLIKGDDIVIIDHEAAFGFIIELFYKNPTPWKLRPQDDYWIKNHYFYKSLMGKEHNFDDFVDKLSTVDENFWSKLSQLIPDEWKGSYVDQIKNDLSLLVQNKTEFKAGLKRILSC